MNSSDPGSSQGTGNKRLEFAGYNLMTCVLTRFRLDGGAMFGSVPKVLWERSAPADAKNRVGLVARALVLRSERHLVLVDAGLGDKLGPRDRDNFAVDEALETTLAFRWQDVTDFILTHLHFDHAGGVTTWDESLEKSAGSRRARLRVPRARVHLDRSNWLRAQTPNVRERASYLEENILPLKEADLRLSTAPTELLPEIRAFPSNGHTRGLQWVLVGEGRGAVAFPADLVPTSAHLHLPYVMGYDICVETLLIEKEEFLRRAVEGEWIVVFAHDEKVPAARIVRDKNGRYQLGEVIHF